MASPHFEMRPVRSTSPDWYLRGVKPKCAPTARERANRAGTSTVARKVSATGTNTRHRHKPAAYCIFAGETDEQVVEFSKPISERPPHGQKRDNNDHQFGVAGEFADPSLKFSGCDLAKIVTKITKESADFVFDVLKLRSQELPRGEHGAQSLTHGRLDMDRLVQTDAHHLRDASRACLSVLLSCAESAAFMCRVSTQMTGSPAATNPA